MSDIEQMKPIPATNPDCTACDGSGQYRTVGGDKVKCPCTAPGEVIKRAAAQPFGPPSRTFTRRQLQDEAMAWMKVNYGEMKAKESDWYYARLGQLIEFIGDIIPEE